MGLVGGEGGPKCYNEVNLLQLIERESNYKSNAGLNEGCSLMDSVFLKENHFHRLILCRITGPLSTRWSLS